jgi:hypothetical protein
MSSLKEKLVRSTAAFTIAWTMAACGTVEESVSHVEVTPIIVRVNTSNPDSTENILTADVAPNDEDSTSFESEVSQEWQGKFWDIGRSTSFSGGLELDSYEEEMQTFRNEIAIKAEEYGFGVESVELVLVGNNASVVEKDGRVEQSAPSEYYGLMVVEDKVVCFTKNNEGIQVDQSCNWFKKSQNIWGQDYSLQVVASPGGEALVSLLIKEEDDNIQMFRLRHDQLGEVVTLEEVSVDGEMYQDENRVWILDGDLVPTGEAPISGVLIAGTNSEDLTKTFLLECQPIELEGDFKQGIVFGLVDLAKGSIPIAMVGTDGIQKDIGYFNLADGSWNGMDGYADVNVLFDETAKYAEHVGAIDLEGFHSQWNMESERIEYVDTNGKAIAFWSENGRIELMPGVVELDFFAHRGLFAEETAQVIAQNYSESGKMPLPIRLPSEGSITETTSFGLSTLSLSGIGDNQPVIAFSTGTIMRVMVTAGSAENDSVKFQTASGDIYYLTGKISNGNLAFSEVEPGDVMYVATTPDFSQLPIEAQREAFIIIDRCAPGNEKSVGLADLMRDDLGRIIVSK